MKPTKWTMRIQRRIDKGGLPLAFVPWDKRDITGVAMALTTRPNAYDRKSGCVVFEKRGIL